MPGANAHHYGFGQPATDNSSCLGVQPANQLQCNVMPCDFCSLTNCASQVQLFLTRASWNLARFNPKLYVTAFTTQHTVKAAVYRWAVKRE